jgi:hypothetical protein
MPMNSVMMVSALAVGRERAGVVVADHHDQPGPDDRQQRLQMRRPAAARRGVIDPDGTQRAADVARAAATTAQERPPGH